MRKILVGLVMLIGSTSIAHADGVVIPVSIKINAFIEDMKQQGMDLSGCDECDGKIEDSGTKIKVITYRPVTIEQMDLMKDAALRNRRI